MFRNPVFLDIQLMLNLADYLEIDLHGDAEVTTRSRDEKSGKFGVDKIVQAGKSRGAEQERTETYERIFRPVRAINDVVDAVLARGEAIDLTEDSDQSIAQRALVQVEATSALAPATEIGAMMASFVPLIVETLSEGRSTDDIDQNQLMSAFLNPKDRDDVVHLYELEMPSSSSRFYVLVDPAHLFGEGTATDDLEGEITILATADRVLSDGTSYPIEKYFLPGLNRASRKILAKSGIHDALVPLAEAVGMELGPDSLSIDGPAVVLKPIAIY